MARYRFATPRVKGCRVLDIACGTGVGLPILLGGGVRWVVGVDVDVEAARVAQVQLQGPRGRVLIADGCHLPFAEQSFEVITSFETLEHLEHRDWFLAELRRVLVPAGLCILSTPNASLTLPVNGKPRNPFHVHEYTVDELRGELCSYFAFVEMLGQVIDSRFLVPPSWDEQDRLTGPWMRAHVLVWRLLNRFPFSVRDYVSRALLGQPFYPGETDYHFSGSNVETASVLVALCRNPRPSV